MSGVVLLKCFRLKAENVPVKTGPADGICSSAENKNTFLKNP